MTLVFACIAPHGSEIIPELASRPMIRKFEATRIGMRDLARRISDAKPHTIVVASPHNLRLVGQIAVVVTKNSSGSLEGSSKKSVFLRANCDVEFGRKLIHEARKKGLPVVGANYGTSEGPASCMQMDWGTLVPLWFVLKERRAKSKIVIVAPSREIPLRKNFLFGRIMARLMENDKTRRFVFIASADQAHAHRKSGPYGFSASAAQYDNYVLDAIRNNRLKRVLGLGPKFVERAKPDSLWQMAILAGIIDRVPMQSELLSYQVPTYYGMICASFQPA
jgi:aromatic ring-opening dioxygenase LigB subunit